MSWKKLRRIWKDGWNATRRSLLKSKSVMRGRRNDFYHSHTASAGCLRRQQFSLTVSTVSVSETFRRMPHVNSFLLTVLASLDLGNSSSGTDAGQACGGQSLG